MKLQWSQSNVLITGASSGIGQAMALQLAPKARALVLIARRQDRLTQLKNELLRLNSQLKVEIYSCDVTDQAQADETLRRVQKDVGVIDVLINNAGMGDLGFFATSDWAKLEQMMALNMKSVTYLTRQLVGPMTAQKSGGILMVSSTAGLQTTPGFGVYSGTKYYIHGLTEALRAELAISNIVVSELCPGPVTTEFLSVAKRSPLPISTSFLEISSEQCAREALRGFELGRAVIIPGLIPKVVFFLHRFIPRAVVSFFLRMLALQIAKSAEKISQGKN